MNSAAEVKEGGCGVVFVRESGHLLAPAIQLLFDRRGQSPDGFNALLQFIGIHAAETRTLVKRQ